MQDSLIVLVDPDRDVQRRVTAAAIDLGLTVVSCDTARRGVNACCALEPACVVTEQHLPDEPGVWLVRALREQPTQAGLVPVVMTGTGADRATVTAAQQAGVDFFVAKPFDAIDLVAQVRALVEMATRIRDRAAISSMQRAIAKETPSSGTPAVPLTGRLEVMPIASVLAALELDQRSGTVRIHAPEARALDLFLSGGALVGGRQAGEGLDAAEALRRALALSTGRLDFEADPARPAPANAATLARLLIHVLADDASPPAPAPARPPIAPPAVSRPPPPASGPPPKPARPPRRTTLRSQAAATPIPAHRSSSDRIAGAISVESAEERPSAPEPRGDRTEEPPTDEDVVIADNDSTR